MDTRKESHRNVSNRITADQLGLGWLSGITQLDTAKAIRTTAHQHPYIELIFCLRGELSYRIDGYGTVTVSAGSGIVIPHDTNHVVGGGMESPSDRFSLHIEPRSGGRPRHSVFSPSDLPSFRRVLLDKAGIPFWLGSNLQSSVRRLAPYISRSAILSASELGFVRAPCCCILFQTVDILRKPLIAPRTQMMDTAVEFIERHYAEEFRIDNLIQHIGYGRTQFFALFKRHTGLTPNEYLVRLRIRKARELVEKGQSDVSSVSKAVGFTDPAYFKNVYRRYTATGFFS